MRRCPIAFAAAMIAVCLSGCTAAKQPAPELLEPVGVRVETAAAVYDTVSAISCYDGAVVPYVQPLSFLTDGALGQIAVMPGDTVSAGQVLATLDTESLNDQIQTLEDRIDDAQTLGYYSDRQLELDISIARQELAMLSPDSTDYAVKQIQIRQLELKLEQQQELCYLQVRRQSAQLEQLRQSLEQAQLTAPFDGTVVYITAVKPGQKLRSTDVAVCIADPARLSVRTGYMPDRTLEDANRIYTRIGQHEFALDPVPLDLETYIAMILSEQNPDIYFTFEAEHDAQIGDYAPVLVESGRVENALTVPASALFRDSSGTFVYRIENGTQIRQAVTAGLVTEVKAQILEGLREGDVVYVQP